MRDLKILNLKESIIFFVEEIERKLSELKYY